MTIRKATPEDIGQVKALSDEHRYELGFVRRPALVEAVNRKELIVADDDGGLVGFVAYRHRQDLQTTLYHIVVRPEWRRKGVGRALIETLKAESVAQGKRVIQLKCPEDLVANQFYHDLGFHVVEKESGKNRALLVWQLSSCQSPELGLSNRV
jgi:N-acetylglutamate synthase-like GNAT family acetyltransferase